jgi:hypothetical protein
MILSHSHRSFADPACPTRPDGRPVSIIEISDDFAERLFHDHADTMHRGNLHCIDHAIQNLPTDDPLLEIGSGGGLCTNLLVHFKQQNGKTNPLFTCDRWISADTGPRDQAKARDEYIRNIQRHSRADLPWTLELLSDEFFEAWDADEAARDVLERPIRLGGKFSFCLLNGSQNYEQSKRDFLNCAANLVRGGFIFFDNSADDLDWEVREVVKEVAAREDFELVMKNPNYLFRKL